MVVKWLEIYIIDVTKFLCCLITRLNTNTVSIIKYSMCTVMVK